jgi:hypothetical protein
MAVIEGSDELIRRFDRLRRGVGRLARGAVGKAAESAARQIQFGLGSESVRKTIGWRATQDARFVAAAKLGVAVGRGSKAIRRVTSRGGVGIDSRNVHWMILGTADRYTGTKRSRLGRQDTGKRKRFTGRMPPQERPIPEIFDASGAKRVLEQSFFTDLYELAEDLS